MAELHKLDEGKLKENNKLTEIVSLPQNLLRNNDKAENLIKSVLHFWVTEGISTRRRLQFKGQREMRQSADGNHR